MVNINTYQICSNEGNTKNHNNIMYHIPFAAQNPEESEKLFARMWRIFLFGI